MRIDLGLVLAIVIEYIIFIYYADTLFYRKKSKLFTYSLIAVMSVINMISCMFGVLFFNVITQILGHLICFLVCYRVSVKTAVFHSVVILVFTTTSEMLVIGIPTLRIPQHMNEYTPVQSLIITVMSRIIYIVEIMIAIRIFVKKNNKYKGSVALIVLPLLSAVVLWLVFLDISESILIISAIISLINMIIFALDQKMFRNEIENLALKEAVAKDKVTLEEYNLLSEKYEQTRIFRHDIKEHLTVLNSLINESPEKAKAYIAHICEKEGKSTFANYSDNKILNILLSKKKSECVECGIQLLIDPIGASLGFINDMDVVSLFSNLLNNAIEKAKESCEKKIFFNITTANESFVVIKISNSSDKAPIVQGSLLVTTKDNDTFHGIGMHSIKSVIEKYDGALKWSYDEKGKFFNTTVILKK